jgi:hypothetical protein
MSRQSSTQKGCGSYRRYEDPTAKVPLLFFFQWIVNGGRTMKYQPFDIVVLRLKYGGKIYAIVDVVPDRPADPYVVVRLDRAPLTKRFWLAEEEILARIGSLDPEAIKLDPGKVETAPSLDWQIGQVFARSMAELALTDLDRRRWAYLASLQPGDCVAIRRVTRRGALIEHHRFQEVLPGGQKYHFLAVNDNGTVYKWTLESLHLKSEQQ